MVFEFTFDTHNKEEIKDAIIRLNELRGDLDRILRLIELIEQNEIHVGDIVKVTHTGEMYTRNTNFFADEIIKNKHNNDVVEQLASLASRYDFEKSWFLNDGVVSLDDIMFKVEYISEDKKAVISIVEDYMLGNKYSKTYIISINGLERG